MIKNNDLPFVDCCCWGDKLEMYKIRYFLTVKYFMKYFGNISVFN